MQFPGLFKRGYSISRRLRHLASRETHRDTFYAVSASLAMHIGLALILTTATAMSASLKLGEVSIIHVSLVSMNTEEISSTSSLPDAGHQKSGKDRERIIETATIVKPVDKQDRQESAVALIAHNVIATQPLNTPVTQRLQLLGSGETDTSPAQQDRKGNGSSVMSGNPLSGEVSLAIPRYRENTHPAYPLIARIRGHEGIVILSVEIFTDGSVGSLKIKKSSGYAALDKSALEAVKTWKFEPGRKIGKPAIMWVDVPVKFVLKYTTDVAGW
jgi:protein TonB